MKKIYRKLPKKVRNIIWKSANTLKKIGKPKTTPIPQEELYLFKTIAPELKVVFDVGARTDIDYYNIHPKATYHIFEPNLKFTKQLKKKAQGLPITVNEFGLSNVNADDLVYYKNSQSFEPNKDIPFGEEDKGDRFSVRRLDDYVEEHEIDHIEFLKIDTEGFDYNVMLGGKNTIKNKVSYIQFETWDTTLPKCIDLLKGYELYLIMEPAVIATLKKHGIHYKKKIVKIDSTVLMQIETILFKNRCGSNVWGFNKKFVSSLPKKLK